jgi:pimeloyl-ACP methyl ester carboxylesterase
MTRLIPLGVLALLTSIARAAPASAPMSVTRMIETNGHRMAFHVTPGHQPVIVLDAGGGLDSSYWNSILPSLARRTGSEIITYDRAGMGASEEVKGPWSLQGAAQDLATGLERLGATHDVILVADSMAGEVATALAQRHPGWLSGAVFVDASVPQFYTPKEVERVTAENSPGMAALKSAPSTKANRQLLAYAASFAETSRAFHEMSWPATVPVVVIVSGTSPFGTPQDASLWRRAQSQFAKGAPNRQLVIAGGSSHDVVHDRPAVIVTAVRDVISRAGPQSVSAH